MVSALFLAAALSIQGWTILSDSEPDALAVVAAARLYGINHLQLSHQIIEDLHHYFARTLLTARLHKAAAGAYFGYRVYSRGEAFRTPAAMKTLRESMAELPRVAQEIGNDPLKPPVGQWNWAADADAAMRYHCPIE